MSSTSGSRRPSTAAPSPAPGAGRHAGVHVTRVSAGGPLRQRLRRLLARGNAHPRRHRPRPLRGRDRGRRHAPGRLRGPQTGDHGRTHGRGPGVGRAPVRVPRQGPRPAAHSAATDRHRRGSGRGSRPRLAGPLGRPTPRPTAGLRGAGTRLRPPARPLARAYGAGELTDTGAGFRSADASGTVRPTADGEFGKAPGPRSAAQRRPGVGAPYNLSGPSCRTADSRHTTSTTTSVAIAEADGHTPGESTGLSLSRPHLLPRHSQARTHHAPLLHIRTGRNAVPAM